MAEEVVDINVVIAGRTYPLKVKQSDVEVLHGIAKEINEKVKEFQLTYANRDRQDGLSMTLLTYAVELYKSKQKEANAGLSRAISELDQMLDQILT